MDFNMSIQDGDHVSRGGLPSRDPSRGQPQLLTVSHSGHEEAWILVLNGLDVHVKVLLQVVCGGRGVISV